MINKNIYSVSNSASKGAKAIRYGCLFQSPLCFPIEINATLMKQPNSWTVVTVVTNHTSIHTYEFNFQMLD